MVMKNFYKKLPDGYLRVLTIDMKNKKLMLRLNLIACIILLPFMFAGFYQFGLNGYGSDPDNILWSLLGCMAVYFILMAVYLVLHELTHGAVYWFVTRQKLTFGFNGMIAWCGVPKIYVNRKTALAALLAPFLVFDVIFGIMAVVPESHMISGIGWLLLGTHISGCIGDLYDTSLLLFRLKQPDLLMKDTGPVQSFYLPDQEAAAWLKDHPADFEPDSVDQEQNLKS